VKELSDVWFPDASPAHKGIFAQSEECENRVKRILLRCEAVHTDGEWEDELLKKNEND
jgi:hypothetical protein